MRELVALRRRAGRLAREVASRARPVVTRMPSTVASGPEGPQGPPLVLIGAPRSGTTYLQSLIDADPRIVMTNETRVLTWLHRSIREAVDGDKAVARMKGEIVAHLQAELPRVVRDFYRDLSPTATWWGDKNPFYSTEEGVLETIDDLFPGTRYVHLIRDGRDVVTSLHRRTRSDGRPWSTFDGGHDLWLRSLTVARRFAERAGDRYLELRYEDLITDDEGHLARVLRHYGVDPHEESLAYARRQQADRTPLSSPTRTLEDASRSAWEEEWNGEQQLESLDRLGDALVDLGYETPDSLAELRARIRGDLIA